MINGIYTGIMLVVFLGIVAWAWSKSNKSKFDKMSRMALKDDDQITNNTDKQTKGEIK
ncbi:hypothetical protein MNBD_GAMMA02-349 [hydrothermal vent metagenome]|uniref:Cytochrome c oxidase subunit CcoQ n=1 Tax=hydrothermal vent metagenome TaxID=652676 RepID=A0A3B0VT57_9ZZZZ